MDYSRLFENAIAECACFPIEELQSLPQMFLGRQIGAS